MIRHTSDSKCLAVEISCYAMDIGIQFSIVFYRDSRFATVCTEDDVVKRLYITHDLNILVYLVFVACFQHAGFRGCRRSPTLRSTSLRLCGVIRIACLQHARSLFLFFQCLFFPSANFKFKIRFRATLFLVIRLCGKDTIRYSFRQE